MLIREFNKKTKNRFYMYQTDQFIRYSNIYLELEETEDKINFAVVEAQEIREFNKESFIVASQYEPTNDEIINLA